MNYSLAIAYDILYNTYIDSRKGAKNKMMTEHKLAINFDTNVTVSDILEQKTLDVTSLKQDTPEGKVREHVDEATWTSPSNLYKERYFCLVCY